MHLDRNVNCGLLNQSADAVLVMVRVPEFLSNTKNRVVKTAWLTRPGREKGSPLTTRVWGWRQWAHQNHTALHRERQNQSKGFRHRLGCRITIRKLWELEINHEGYQSHMTFIIAPLCGIWQHGLWLSAPDYTHVIYQITKACYWGTGSYILFCKYIHISSVRRLLMEQGWSKTRCGCKYFQTCRE